MKTAGVVLDFYDDQDGELLKRSFPDPEQLPEEIKTAHFLSSEERDCLRDEAFALILQNEGKTLRKFACVDPGNTLLSALYLMEHGDRLPEEAMKLASANITAACEYFGLPLRDIEKIAAAKKERPTDATEGGRSRSRDPMQQPLVGDEANWAERTNLVSVRGGADAGRVIPMANQMKTASTKEAQDHVDDAQEKADNKRDGFKPSAPKKDINLDSFHKLNPEAKPPSKSKNSTKHHWAKEEKDACGPMKMANATIDVSGLEAPLKMKKASARHLALGRYPLDSFGDVRAAVQFFSENYLEFSPEQRHEFAVKTASRANELGIALTDDLNRYGSTEYAPDVEAHLANRRAISPEYKKTWDDLQEKRASVEPEEFVKLLAAADEESGVCWLYGGEAADPYYATFGGNKVKEASDSWSWMSRTGDYVTGDQLHKLALNGRPLVMKQFDSALASAFAKDPITVFESLPDFHKMVMARLASQEFDGTPNN